MQSNMSPYRLSKEDTEKISKSINVGTKTVSWRGHRISVRSLLSFSDVTSMVDSIISSCTDDESGYFMPESIDFALRFFIVSMYGAVEMPENPNDQYVLLYATDLYDTIAGAANAAQIEAIKQAVNIFAGGLIRNQGL